MSLFKALKQKEREERREKAAKAPQGDPNFSGVWTLASARWWAREAKAPSARRPPYSLV
jgi:hypothetical protein